MTWRSVLSIHPAAELFPRMPLDERRVLGEDIRKHGLREPVVLQRQYRRRADGSIANEHDYKLVLLNGISRLDAMEETDFPLVRDGKLDPMLGHRALGLTPLAGATTELASNVDPYDFVISRNLHRRHLTAKQKREVIAKLLKATPEKSNRQIAAMTKTDHKTVGSERTEMEGRGEIPHVADRRDTWGRKQPARKKPSRKSRKPTMKPQGTTSKPSATTDDKPQRDDIAPAIENADLRSAAANPAAKPAPQSKSASWCSICHKKKPAVLRPIFICDSCVDIYEIREAAPAADDGLDIPEFLRRGTGASHG